jgi:hypothetical protein
MALQHEAHLLLFSILVLLFMMVATSENMMSRSCWALFGPDGSLICPSVFVSSYFMGLPWSHCGGGHTYVLWYFSFSVIMVALDNHGDMDPSGLGLFSYACLSMGWFYEICCLYSPLVY